MHRPMIALAGILTGYCLAFAALAVTHQDATADFNPPNLHQKWPLPWSDFDGERRAAGCGINETAGVCNHGVELDISTLDQTTSDPIRALWRGASVDYFQTSTCGLGVGINHGTPGFERSVYCHLSSHSGFRLTNGRVNQGEFLGIAGSTGVNATGDHLHFYLQNQNGVKINFDRPKAYEEEDSQKGSPPFFSKVGSQA